jgi:hypothetical protein
VYFNGENTVFSENLQDQEGVEAHAQLSVESFSHRGYILNDPPVSREAVKKSACFFSPSFRRKLESSIFTHQLIDWTPAFAGVTTENQFFHSFRGVGVNAKIIN